jgi:hypothetical protein
MPSQHDSAFKRLFSHPELVHALLELVPGCPVGTATGFDRLNCSFVSSSEQQRSADMVWRIFCGSGLFYLLLEFQSTVDLQMEERMKVYSGLLSQELYLQHKSREHFDLLPVVVYSGRRKWRKTGGHVADWLKPLQTGQGFYLVNEERAGGSVIGDVIRLVRADTLDAVVESQAELLAWPVASTGLRHEINKIASERAQRFGADKEGIMSERNRTTARREFTEEEHEALWKLYKATCEVWKDDPEVLRLIEATDKATHIGTIRGLRKGLRQGRELGREQGLELGREQGREQGLEQGREQGRVEVLREMLGKACLLHGAGEFSANKIANADSMQLESWLQRVIAGERLEDVLGRVGP